MSKLKKILLRTVLCVLSMLCVHSLYAEDLEGGNCGIDGDNLVWTFYPSKGTLKITGSGEMADYHAHGTPWKDLETSITRLELSDDITRIGEYAFFCCNLLDINLPKGLTSIGYEAFGYTPWLDKQSEGCAYLDGWLIDYIGEMPSKTTLQIKEGTIGVADYFVTGGKLVKIVFPASLRYIGEYSFNNLTNLTNIQFSEGLLSIGEGAFCNNAKLSEVLLPEGLIQIGFMAFYECKNLRRIYLPGSLKSTRESCFASCSTLTDIVLSEGIESLGTATFQDCTGITGITLPNSLLHIGQCAFAGCSELTEIVLPKCLQKIEVAAFYECAKLNKVTSLNPIPPETALYSSFDTFNNEISLYVPYGTADEYSKAWKGFSSITELEGEKYTVTFMIGDKVVDIHSVPCGKAITPPFVEEREGYTFIWHNLPELMPSNDITIYGEYRINSYLLTYVVDGETVQSESIAYGTAITLPEAPTKEGYTFSGWSDAPATMPAEDVTISGTFTVNRYVVTFKVGDVVVSSESMEYGASIVAPEAPEKEGYTFNGWGEVDAAVPAHDVTYEGTYTVNSYLLTYMVDGEVVQTESVAYGALIELIAEPAKEGHTFSGWNNAPATMPAEDVTISGTFTINKYVVTFKVGDEVVSSESMEYGASIVAPEASEKDGHTFNGWGEVDATVPAHDVTYEGTYTANIYKVYYYVGDELVHTAEVAYGEAIPEYIYEPTAEGDEFLGWVGETYATMPAHDVTYTANITNGIEHSEFIIQNSQFIYDLSGRRIVVDDLRELQKGVYIINGRKVLIND